VSPAPLTVSSALSSWQLDVPAVLLVVVLAAWYSVAVRRVRRSGARWSPLRAGAFVGGLALVVVSTCSFVGVYERQLFWVLTLQVCLLLLVAPLLLGVGAPVALAAAARGRGPAGEGTDGAGRKPRLLRVLGAPGVGPLLLILVTVLVFFSPLLEAALRHPPLLDAVQLVLLAAGLLMALPVTDEGMGLSSLGYAALIGLGFFEFLLDGIPGIALRLHGGVLALPYWSSLHRGWGPGPLADQHLAGGVLWFFGEAGDLPFLVVAMVAWIRADAREARRIDRELDLAAAAAVPAAAVPTAPDEGGAAAAVRPPELERPWWETDAAVFGEARARRYGWTTQDEPEGPPDGA